MPPSEVLRGVYVGSLMCYIEAEYDNIPKKVTPEMEQFFNECFDQDPPMCYPNAAGLFYEMFLRKLSFN